MVKFARGDANVRGALWHLHPADVDGSLRRFRRDGDHGWRGARVAEVRRPVHSFHLLPIAARSPR